MARVTAGGVGQWIVAVWCPLSCWIHCSGYCRKFVCWPMRPFCFRCLFPWHFLECCVSGNWVLGGLMVCSRLTCNAVAILCFFWIRRSKTNQAGRGVRGELFGVTGSPACPLQVVSRFLELRPGRVGPLLLHANGSALSRYQFTAVFRGGLGVLGFCPSDFACHSFRIGAATEAVRWGVSEGALRRIGRWESLC